MARKPSSEQGTSRDFRFTGAPSAGTNASSKFHVPDEMLSKWQRVVDLMGRIAGVPAGLIMKVDPPQIEVLVSSSTEGNPYKKGKRAELNTGLYCETVMAQRSPLLVPDALKDPDWDHNPDIKLGMVFYLGFPLQWPDGEIFGTICVLDIKENPNVIAYQDLISEFKGIIESDLSFLVELTKRKQAEEALKFEREQLLSIFNSINQVIYISDPISYEILYVNDTVKDALGKNPVGSICYKEFQGLESPCEFCTNQIILKGKYKPYQWEHHNPIVNRDYTIIDRIIKWSDGRDVRLEIAIDITDRKRAEQSQKKYMELSIKDSLTKLYNSRHFFSQLKAETERADRYSRPLSLLLLDIDNFKHYNDRYGHLEGDKVLAKIGEVLLESLRETDSAYRYGGEEFTVILPETGGEEATNVAEKIRKRFKTETFYPTSDKAVHVTVSIGVAQYIFEEELSAFIKRADNAMYVSKEKGKNRVFFSR